MPNSQTALFRRLIDSNGFLKNALGQRDGIADLLEVFNNPAQQNELFLQLKQPSRFWSIIGWKDIMAAKTLIALIVVTVLYFSPVMLLVSLGLSAFILAPYAYHLGQWVYHKLMCERGVKSASEPPIILNDTVFRRSIKTKTDD